MEVSFQTTEDDPHRLLVGVGRGNAIRQLRSMFAAAFRKTPRTHSRSDLYCLNVSRASFDDNTSTTTWLNDWLEQSALRSSVCSSFCPLTIIALYGPNISNVHMDQRTFIIHGCCMLADISGFTRMSSRLCDRGMEGLDILRTTTSEFLGTLVDTIYAFGGDVISFAGDALICLFRPLDGNMEEVTEECCHRATACAFLIKDRCTEDFSAHTAVACGEMCLGTLGGYQNEWSYLLSGSCINELSQCLDDAGPQETVITRSVYELFIGSNISATKTPTGNFKVQSVVDITSSQKRGILELETTHDISHFVPRPVLQSLAAGPLNLAELRVVTTLFMKLDSYSPTEHKDLTSLQPFYHAMQEIIYECGGYIRQFIIDDKGCVLIVLWGVPTASFPNNCSRAVRCAASMATKTISLNHACSIGITTGTAYCGTVGSSRRQDYVAMGASVNLSARFMSKADCRILIDQSTIECLPHEIAKLFSTVEPPLKLRGFDEPVPSYYFTSHDVPVVSTADLRRDRDIFLGRDITVALDRACNIALRLKDADDDILSTSGHVNTKTNFLFIHGASGMGKTTILNHFYRNLKQNVIDCVFVSLNKKDHAKPYHALKLLFYELISYDGSVYRFETEEEQRSTIMGLFRLCFPNEGMAQYRQHRFAIVKAILGLTWDLNTTLWTEQTRPAEVQAMIPMDDNDTFTVLLAYLMTARKCMVIVIDNAHCMCSHTWNQIQLFTSRHIPVLIAMSIIEFSENTARNSKIVDLSEGTIQAVSSIVENQGARSVRSRGGGTPISTSMMVNSYEHSIYIDRLSECAPGMTIRLIPLSAEGIARTICAALAPNPVPNEVIEKITKLSRGSPFWVSHLTQVVKECGTDAFVALLNKGVAQNMLAACILARFNQAHASVIKIASVIGEEFMYQVLHEVLPSELRGDLHDTLNALTNGGLICKIADDSYTFQSPLIRNVIYNIMPPSDVATLHHNIADSIQRLFAGDLHDHYAVLTYHYNLSPQPLRHKALSYAISAAQQKSSQFDFVNGYCFLRIAFDVSKVALDYSDILEICDTNIELLEMICETGTCERNATLQMCLSLFTKLKDTLNDALAGPLAESPSVSFSRCLLWRSWFS